MKIERRRFDHIIHNLRQHDYHTTWDTIEKFDMDNDVEVTLDNGDKIITSPMMANRLRKREQRL